MDYVDSIVRSAVQGIVQVGEVDIGEAQEAAAAAVQQNVASQRMRNRMPGMPPQAFRSAARSARCFGARRSASRI